ncbi:MAG: hydantoinase/oxoprolinase family protein, partial [Alphaproteobacteria bacterium]|nr:hydantoinase/oxoprolinase family protein [Alphaproteobacteria bacterium]
TSSDIAVAAGYVEMGERAKVANLDKDMVTQAVDVIHDIMADVVDRMKTSGDPVPLILVGGGSVLINRDIPGTSDTIIPDHASVANAIGAAIAQIGAEIDKVFSYDDIGREKAMDMAKQEVIEKAVTAGALRDTIEIIDIEEVPLAYVPGGAVRLRIKAAGQLNFDQKKG